MSAIKIKYCKKNNTIEITDIESNNKLMDLDININNFEKLKQMVEIFEEECVSKIHVHAHYNDGKYAYLSWWYADIPNAHDAYEFCRTQFETQNETNKQMYFDLKQNHFDVMIEYDEFRNVFDIGWYRGTDTYYIDKIPPLCILEKYVNEGEWYYFSQYVNYLYKHKKEEIENAEGCDESKCEESEHETT